MKAISPLKLLVGEAPLISLFGADLHSIMDSLEDYKNPNIKPVFVEVAKTDGFPRLLRIKAIQSLAYFEDQAVLDE